MTTIDPRRVYYGPRALVFPNARQAENASFYRRKPDGYSTEWKGHALIAGRGLDAGIVVEPVLLLGSELADSGPRPDTGYGSRQTRTRTFRVTILSEEWGVYGRSIPPDVDARCVLQPD